MMKGWAELMGAESSDRIVVEGCVTTLAEALTCEEAGADRLELCVDLSVGGLTPSAELVEKVCAGTNIPVLVMIRPHARTFVVTPETQKTMLAQMEELSRYEVAGFVLGALDSGNKVNIPFTRDLVQAAEYRPVTFHRAFDETSDLLQSAEALTECGVARVLTGGGPNSAWDGRHNLKTLVDRFSPTLTIVGGGSIRADHVLSLLSATGLREIHARASGIPHIRYQV